MPYIFSQSLIGKVTELGNTNESSIGRERVKPLDFSSALKHAIVQRSISVTNISSGGTGEASLTIGATDIRHFSPNKKGGEKEDLQQKMLGVRAYRQQIIASNIANADTPGYKAIDIDINDAVNLNKAGQLSLAKSSSSHMDKSSIEQFSAFNIKYHVPFQDGVDGNTVEIDVERQKFAENSLMYQFSLDRVGGEFKHMIELFQTLK